MGKIHNYLEMDLINELMEKWIRNQIYQDAYHKMKQEANWRNGDDRLKPKGIQRAWEFRNDNALEYEKLLKRLTDYWIANEEEKGE